MKILKKLTKNELVPNPCERCKGKLELCLSDYPWNEEHWICVECDSTYSKELQ
jgi:hypothetical protein